MFHNLLIPGILLDPVNSSLLATLHNIAKSVRSSLSNSLRAFDNQVTEKYDEIFQTESIKPYLTRTAM